MKVALSGTRERSLSPPDNVVTRFVHKETGEVVAESDPNGFEEYFLISNAPEPVQETVTGYGSTIKTQSGAVETAPSTTEGLF